MTHPLLNNITGKWFLQENYYLLDSKKQRGYKKKYHFLLDLNRILDRDLNLRISNKELYKANEKSNHLYIDNSLYKPDYYFKGIKSSFSIYNIKHNFFRISKQNHQQKVFYEEYIYLVNKNFMISITSLKAFKKNYFLGVKISSYIRQLRN